MKNIFYSIGKKLMIKKILLIIFFILIQKSIIAETIYVSNEKDHNISVIDGSSLEVIKTVKVGHRPRGIILSKDKKEIIICTSDDNRIAVVDAASLEVAYYLPSGPDPELMVMDEKGKFIYVANEDDNMVTVVDYRGKKIVKEIPVGVEPEGMGLSPDGKILVNTSETTNMAHFISTETLEIKANVLVDARPRVAQYTKDGKFVWVSSEIGGTISIIDPEKYKIIKKIGFNIPGLSKESIQPVGIRLDNKRKLAYIALGPANRIAIVNMNTFDVEKYILTGQRVWNLMINSDGTRLFTTNGVSNDISVIDIEKQKVIKSIPVGRYPWGVAIKE